MSDADNLDDDVNDDDVNDDDVNDDADDQFDDDVDANTITAGSEKSLISTGARSGVPSISQSRSELRACPGTSLRQPRRTRRLRIRFMRADSGGSGRYLTGPITLFDPSIRLMPI